MADVFKYNSTAVVKCDSCGADMVYDPSRNAVCCSYCGAERTIDRRLCFKRSYDDCIRDGQVKLDDSLYKCPNCGAQTTLAPFETAIKCPYCGATNMVELGDLKGLKPDGILPFKLSKDDALLAGKKWIKKKLFAPGKLKKSFSVKNFHGVYIPSYAFTTHALSSYEGRLGEIRTRTVGSGKDRHIETYTYWFRVQGTREDDFDDVAVEASTQLEQKELNSILPYDLENLEGYNKDYLAGFNAERYDTAINDGFDIAKDQIKASIRNKIISKHNADVVDYLNVNTTYTDTKFNYMLLPLWVCAFAYRKKTYRFLINGRTGKSTGKSPVSPLRVCLAIFIPILIAVILYLVWTLSL